jgi:hypothetical protein
MKNAPEATTSKPLVAETRHHHIPKLRLVTCEPFWTPPVEEGPLTTSQVLHVSIESISHEIETKIVAVLRRPRNVNESHAEYGTNREAELCVLFAELDVTRAFHLRRRLETARADDLLSSSFQRLVVDRRQRLLRFLGDARRRSMLGT